MFILWYCHGSFGKHGKQERLVVEVSPVLPYRSFRLLYTASQHPRCFPSSKKTEPELAIFSMAVWPEEKVTSLVVTVLSFILGVCPSCSGVE
jgi:hypothetical protein